MKYHAVFYISVYLPVLNVFDTISFIIIVHSLSLTHPVEHHTLRGDHSECINSPL